VDSTCNGITAHWKTNRWIQQSEREGNRVSDPLEHKFSITQDTQSSQERMEGTDLTRFVIDQTKELGSG